MLSNVFVVHVCVHVWTHACACTISSYSHACIIKARNVAYDILLDSTWSLTESGFK